MSVFNKHRSELCSLLMHVVALCLFVWFFFLSIVQVLSKFPVIQHFVFGTLLSIQEAEVFKKPL